MGDGLPTGVKAEVWDETASSEESTEEPASLQRQSNGEMDHLQRKLMKPYAMSSAGAPKDKRKRTQALSMAPGFFCIWFHLKGDHYGTTTERKACASKSKASPRFPMKSTGILKKWGLKTFVLLRSLLDGKHSKYMIRHPSLQRFLSLRRLGQAVSVTASLFTLLLYRIFARHSVISLGIAIHRHLYCPWCWHALGIRRWYPHTWSSTICPYHYRQTRTRFVAHRARRMTDAAQHEALMQDGEKKGG
jgi:hypothetical protein